MKSKFINHLVFKITNLFIHDLPNLPATFAKAFLGIKHQYAVLNNMKV